MAVAITKVAGADTVFGNKRVKVRDLAFSGNYPDGGEVIAAADVGLRRIEFVNFAGPAMATDRESGNPVGWDSTAGTVVFFEGSTAGTAIGEKTDSEAHATGASVRAQFYGF